jgi:16S rRNA (guanine527-N7)-methyltransferase
MLLTNEAEARAWLATLPGVSRETIERIDLFVALLREANKSQNLIAASTAGEGLWLRHIADSAQLVTFLPNAKAAGRWIDLGSGPGLPGLIIALLLPGWTIRLVESRRLRCDFLREAVAQIGLTNVEIIERRVEQLESSGHDVISARAFAPLPKLLTASRHLARKNTLWLLPKGRNAVNELSSIAPAWQGLFHVEPSLTDAEAQILVGQGIAAG